jgi:hypothetical protein
LLRAAECGLKEFGRSSNRNPAYDPTSPRT